MPKDPAAVKLGRKETGHIEYGQTSYASTKTALANLDEMLAKFTKSLMQTQPRIKCTIRIDIEGQKAQ